jgi:hypothetical protein
VDAKREDANDFEKAAGSTVDVARTAVVTIKVMKIEGAVGKDSRNVAKVEGVESNAEENAVEATIAVELSSTAEVGAIQGRGDRGDATEVNAADRADVRTNNETGAEKENGVQQKNVDCTDREENVREDSALLDIHWLIIKPALGMAQRGILVPYLFYLLYLPHLPCLACHICLSYPSCPCCPSLLYCFSVAFLASLPRLQRLALLPPCDLSDVQGVSDAFSLAGSEAAARESY